MFCQNDSKIGRQQWTSEGLFELGMDVGGRRKTRSAEEGTRHKLFAGVRPCPSCAGNSAVLFVACYCLSLKFAGVAVLVAV